MADIIAQIKGGKSTAIVTSGPLTTRLAELTDVNIQGVQDGYVLVYSSAEGKFITSEINAGTF